MTMAPPVPEPPIQIIPPAIGAILTLAECVCELLATEGAGPTCWCGVYPGSAVSWEYCAECSNGACGMGYVRLAAISAYDVFPQPVVDDRCAKPLAWALEVGALRCFPQPEDGSIIDPDPMADVAIHQMMDAAALRKAIKCCGVDVGLGTWLPVGPGGGCIGGYWQAYLDIS